LNFINNHAMKTLIQTLCAFFLILAISFNLSAQEIQIDVTFTSDTLIYPFEGIDKISELSMEGSATLNNDTSLVRVILQDETGFQYMVFETYPLISITKLVSIKKYCDETCALKQIHPISLIIQLIDAELTLESLIYDDQEKQDAEQLRYEAKRAKDAEKIETMNKQICFYRMNWVSDDNSLVEKYYEQKKHIFGDGYNLVGFDYYKDGVFEFLSHREYPHVDPDLVRHFDWRERHGANDSTSKYWDGDTLGTGWLTSVKDQGDHENCWAFSAVGQLEAIANLFANDTLDFDQSEREMVFCVEGNCNGGNPVYALNYFSTYGVIPETCFPYEFIDCENDECPQKCAPPNINLTIDDYEIVDESNYDSIRLALINYGPLSIGYTIEKSRSDGHSVVLCGYNFNSYDSTCTWIIKNSWGVEDDWGVNGFCNLKVDHLRYGTVGAVKTPVYANDTALSVNCLDNDGDSLCFWGIGERPSNCPCHCDTIIEDCDDNNPYVGGYDENYYCSCIFEMDEIPHYISADTTWSDSTYVNYQVIIDSGVCLTISSYVAFAPEAGILVRQGGKLILDSAYLTKVCPELWQGIDVLGIDTIQALDEYFGKVVVRNNSIIEFAEIGIANHCRTCGYQDMQCGGMISAENSIFRDNERDIQLKPFNTYWFNHDLPYACVISDCQFVTTDNLYPDHIPITHIDIKDIYGVMIYGCRFENQSDTAKWFPIRGTGISSIDSYFMINRYCLTGGISPCEGYDTCKFSHLEYGIKAMNSKSKRTLNIQALQFDTNLVAISLSGLQNASVLSNEFKLPKKISGVQSDRFVGALFMEGCTGYHVEANSIVGETHQMANPSPANGIGVKNSGLDDNEIYNNTFQKMNTGIISIGQNRGKETGLCLKCNDMYGNNNDFVVISDTTLPFGSYQGIYHYQGDPVDSTSYDAPAGNRFTTGMGIADSSSIKNYNYYNSAEDILYTHHSPGDFQVRPMENHYTSSTIDLKGWQNLTYDKERACPSGLGGGGLKSYSSPRSVINEADIRLAILGTLLEELVDAGNTEALNLEVMTSMPDDGLEVRQELLSSSPYLSDTVMKQAIYKEEVLPNAMIRDILQANPQSAKSVEILNTLDSRYDPMPDYMMAQIMEGKKYLGAKEILEAKIQSWEQIRTKAKADLMREFLLDTNMIDPLDSVIAFLENESDLDSRYDLALTQWDNTDKEGAWTTLNFIPSQFNLSEDQCIDHDNYMDYFGILQTLADSTWQADQLDSVSVSLLFYLKELGNPKIAALARGMLVKGGFYKYIETINFPDLLKSSQVNSDPYKENHIVNNEEKLWLFPNPAGDYVIAYYDLDSKYKTGEIQLIDLNGRLLNTYLIKNGKDQIVIDLKAYPIGLYIISLNSRNQVYESKKISKGGK
jgi:C1A family cysteine protease